MDLESESHKVTQTNIPTTETGGTKRKPPEHRRSLGQNSKAVLHNKLHI